MKYLKTFKESILMPSKMVGDYQIRNYEDLIRYSEDNNFDVVTYDEFHNSLSEVDKRTAPPKNAPNVPFFALFHTINRKPMFVLNMPIPTNRINFGMFGPDFRSIVNDIIGHEKVHQEQNNKRNGMAMNLPNPSILKSYFSNKDEIQAFSWTIANGLSKSTKDIKSAFNLLETTKGSREPHFNIWNDIKKNCDDVVIKKYRKNIYLYLEEIFKEI